MNASAQRRSGAAIPVGTSAAPTTNKPRPRWYRTRQGRIAATIWIPTLVLVVVAGFALSVTYAVALVGLAVALHTVFERRVALLALIAMIPLDWALGVVRGLTSASKLVGVLAVVALLPRLLRVIGRRWHPLAICIVVLVLWSLVGVLWADQPSRVLIKGSSLALIWGVALMLVLTIRTEAELKVLLYVFIAACLLSAVLFLIDQDVRSVVTASIRPEQEQLVTVGPDGGEGRFNPNPLARILCVGTFTCLYMIRTSRSRSFHVLMVAAIVILVAAVIVTKTRAAYVGLPVAAVGSLFIIGGKDIVRRLSAALLLAVLAGIIGFAAIEFGLIGEGVEARAMSIFEQGWHSGGRVDLWTSNLKELFVTYGRGAGIGQMPLRLETQFRTAHNDWFDLAGELGAIGLVCYGLFHSYLFAVIRRAPDLDSRLFVTSVWIFILVVGMAEDDYVLKWVPMAVGLILCVTQVKVQARKAKRRVQLLDKLQR